MFCHINLLIFQNTGAEAFIELEYPHEMELFAEKQAAAHRVDAAADYLGKKCAMTINLLFLGYFLIFLHIVDYELKA